MIFSAIWGVLEGLLPYPLVGVTPVASVIEAICKASLASRWMDIAITGSTLPGSRNIEESHGFLAIALLLSLLLSVLVPNCCANTTYGGLY